jgi:uncharacterized protein
MNMRFVTTLVFGCALFAGHVAAPAAAQTYPALAGPVVDDADLLVASEEATIVEMLDRRRAETGRRVIVATVPDLGGRSIELYAANLAHEWGIAAEANSAILLVAEAERRVRFEFGPPVKGTLIDIGASRVVQRVVLPAFRAGQFRIGIEAGLDELFRMLADGAAAAQTNDEARHLSDLLIDRRVLVPLALVVLVLAYCGLGRGRCSPDREA